MSKPLNFLQAVGIGLLQQAAQGLSSANGVTIYQYQWHSPLEGLHSDVFRRLSTSGQYQASGVTHGAGHLDVGAFRSGDHRLIGESPEVAGAGVHDIPANQEAVNVSVGILRVLYPLSSQMIGDLLQSYPQHSPVIGKRSQDRNSTALERRHQLLLYFFLAVHGKGVDDHPGQAVGEGSGKTRQSLNIQALLVLGHQNYSAWRQSA